MVITTSIHTSILISQSSNLENSTFNILFVWKSIITTNPLPPLNSSLTEYDTIAGNNRSTASNKPQIFNMK